jgi:hypothetical protein
MGPTSSFSFYNYIMTNPQKGIWSLYNSRHDQSTMGIDPMNNISNNNKNTLCSYIISTQICMRYSMDLLISSFKRVCGPMHKSQIFRSG